MELFQIDDPWIYCDVFGFAYIVSEFYDPEKSSISTEFDPDFIIPPVITLKFKCIVPSRKRAK